MLPAKNTGSRSLKTSEALALAGLFILPPAIVTSPFADEGHDRHPVAAASNRSFDVNFDHLARRFQFRGGLLREHLGQR